MRTKHRKSRRYTLMFVFILSMCSLGLLNTAFSLPVSMEHYSAIRVDEGTNLSTWGQFKVLQPMYEPTTMLLLGLGLGMMGLAVAIWKFKN